MTFPIGRQLAGGLLAGVAAVVVGSSWQLVSRHGVTTTLGPLDMVMMRYGIPALLLSPLYFKAGFIPPTASIKTLLIIVLGGGLPFGLLVLAGAQWAPAAHIGLVLAGGVPLFTALGAWLLRGEKLGGWRLLGLGFIASGMLVFGLSAFGDRSGTWRGDALFVAAAALWAAYSLYFRRSGMTPLQGAAFVNGCSTILLLPVLALTGLPKLVSAPWGDVVFQFVGQGIVAGVLGVVTYTATIARLGAVAASLTLAVIPVVTAIGAAWWLSEPVTGTTMVALALVIPGVGLASGALALLFKRTI